MSSDPQVVDEAGELKPSRCGYPFTGGERRGVVALDIYGTVVDTAGMTTQLAGWFGPDAPAAAQLWREKQLEFTFRRALMRRYADFDQCTAQALRAVAAQWGTALDEAAEGALLQAYAQLPPFADVGAGLESLQRTGHRVVALTNGVERSVRALLVHAALDGHFEAILSADRCRTFKPDPAVYALLRELAPRYPQQVCLVSANPFDVIGAKACGLTVAWLRRDPARALDPWELSPDVEIETLEALPGALRRLNFSA
jgi:2-haloacid dehalogenase